MSAPFPAMIFAAGFGTRMRPLTDTLPKPLINVAGAPLIDHALAHLEGAGVTRIVCNAHYRAAQIEAHLAPRDIEVLTETPDILDTGGGLRNALPLLGSGPVITINPDVVWSGPNPIALALAQWDPELMDALLLCIPPERTIGRQGGGDFLRAPSGALTRGPGVVYGGVQILKTDALTEIADTAFSLNLLWDKMIDQGRCHGLIYPGFWCDVGRPDGIAEAEAMLGYAS